MKWLWLCLLPAALFAQDADRLVFSKSFPGSSPAFYEIRLTPSGDAEFRDNPDEDLPLKLKLREADCRAIFAIAAKLDYFKNPLESGLPVARMGEKMFRWEKGKESREQKFNYSLDTDAQALQDWVERIAESALLYYDLERTAKYDRLGVNKTLLHLETAWDKHRLVAHDKFLPLLKRVAGNDSYLNMARERAAKLVLYFSDPEAHQTSPQEEKKGQ